MEDHVKSYYLGLGKGMIYGSAFGAAIGSFVGSLLTLAAAYTYAKRYTSGPPDPDKEEIPEPVKEERSLSAVPPQEYVPDEIITNVS